MKYRTNTMRWYANRAYKIAASEGLPKLAEVTWRRLARRSNVLLDTTNDQHTLSSSSPERIEVDHCVLHEDELVVIAGVPYDDVGGGQRGAQLARAALKTGRRVIYVYIYEKFDFEKGVSVASDLNIPNLEHVNINSITPSQLLESISTNATILIEHPHPSVLPFVELAKIRNIHVIFDLIDDWYTSLGGEWFDANVLDRLVNTADKVVGSAKVLVNQLRKAGRSDAVYAPNAANENVFDRYRTYDCPSDLPKNGRIALYFGSLYGEWFAWDYLEEAAVANPNINFVLIGDMHTRPKLPSNVFFLGSKNIEELPAYLFHADCALLPFRPGQISDAVSPIKIFEYIFMGKPVIATTLPEIEGYPGVHIAHDAEEFARACSLAIATPLKTADIDQFVATNSWHARLDSLLSYKAAAPSVSAVILIHNNQDIIARCLSTLLQHNSTFLKEVIVVDNASTDNGAMIVADQFPEVQLIRNPQNGCALGRNLGASHATGDVIAFFDSDQWFTSSAAFSEALRILMSNAGIGAVGWGAGWFRSFPNDLSGPIVDYLPARGMCTPEATENGYRTDVAYLGTCGMFVPNSVFQASGGFDTYYDPTCFEDTDLSFSIRKLGFLLAYRDLTGIRHEPHQTTGAGDRSGAYLRLFKRNEAYFARKWKDFHFSDNDQ